MNYEIIPGILIRIKEDNKIVKTDFIPTSKSIDLSQNNNNNNNNNNKNSSDPNWKMPFGKYKNVSLSDLPIEYIEWAVDTFDDPLKSKLLAEIELRKPSKQDPQVKQDNYNMVAYGQIDSTNTDYSIYDDIPF